MDALDSVREQIQRVVMEGSLAQEIGEDGDAFRDRLREFRNEARRETAKAELDQLKQELESHTLPPESVRHMEPAAAS